MPVSFPATESGVEINILKAIFTPTQANLVTYLNYKYQTIGQILENSQGEIDSNEDLEILLDEIVKKGGISRRIRNKVPQYAIVPLVLWGIYEQQLQRLNPEFLMNFGQYIQNEYGRELATSKLPKMRVIPVEKSIKLELQVSTYDELVVLIKQAGARIAVQDCICRRVKDKMGKHCQKTDRREVCMSFGDLADLYVEEGWGRKISQAEAFELARKNEQEGLVLMPGNAKQAKFMCACCPDCCGMLGMIKYAPKPAESVACNYFAQVNLEQCSVCEECINGCPMEAISITNEILAINLNRCIGCGLCVPVCPEEALHLIKKDRQTVPPETEEELWEKLMKYRKN
jgi:Pyruvate/2-oxoacid:ferredoxin oxidoreductase delta subunit